MLGTRPIALWRAIGRHRSVDRRMSIFPAGRGASLPIGQTQDGYALPIAIPAAKTISPPRTTSNAACRNRVSI